jgi:hypothetical protein
MLILVEAQRYYTAHLLLSLRCVTQLLTPHWIISWLHGLPASN